MGSVLGRLFRVTTFGESHGVGVGCVIDGCPAGLPLEVEDVQRQLDRRRPGQSRLVTQRDEADRVELLSGVFEGETLGTPIAMLVRNKDARPEAYEHLRDVYRPSHADLAYDLKYGRRDWRGGGRASARETVGRVAAGAVARLLLERELGVEIQAWVSAVGGEELSSARLDWSSDEVEASPTRCPDPEAAARFEARILAARGDGDSVGGVVTGVARGVPAGLGEPVFDRLEAELAHAMMSLPACKGFDIGSGFAGATMRGSEHNDAYVPGALAGSVELETNRSGGVQGGISVGAPVWFRAAFKPTATIARPQQTVDRRGNVRELEARGRHDPCVVPRAVPIVEAMTALVLVDAWLVHRAQAALNRKE